LRLLIQHHLILHGGTERGFKIGTTGIAGAACLSLVGWFSF
jgi:hypothetical protein